MKNGESPPFMSERPPISTARRKASLLSHLELLPSLECEVPERGRSARRGRMMDAKG
jgi:hypothetical protein